ncbi:MAG TPA: hypothetical protein VIR63_04935, partial [Pontiella sp.]
SKILIITDVPSAVARIQSVVEGLDKVPKQVLIESKFIEVSTDDLMDLGVDFATGSGGLLDPGVQVAYDDNNDRWGVEQNDSRSLTPGSISPLADDLAQSLPFNAGLQLLYSRVAGSNFELLLHALEENADVNILSAPRILTQNNQEAAILVGERFPIIEEQQSSSGGGGVPITTGNLEYYEEVGIKLNVIPQVCGDDHINMIVHPIVSSVSGFEQVGTTGTRYPKLKVREAQTQVFLKSSDSVAIGGLQSEADQTSIYGVPFLSDIPLLGRLFRRESTTTKKIDLLIFIKASIVNNEAYAAASKAVEQERLENMDLTLGSVPEVEALPTEEEESVVKVVEESEVDAEAVSAEVSPFSEEDVKEILEIVDRAEETA